MPPALLQPPHQPRSRLLARAPGLGGAPFLARAPVLGGTRPVVPVMRRELVTAHMLQASMTTKPATAIRIDIDHDPGEQQPDADQEPERRLGAPALVAHPRVGRVDGAGNRRSAAWTALATAGRRHEAPARSARAGAACPARRSSATGHTGSAAGPPPPTAHPAAAHQAGSRTPGWLIASAAAIAAAALAGTALRLHHRKPATVPDSQPGTRGSAAGSAKPEPGDRRHAPWRLPKAG